MELADGAVHLAFPAGALAEPMAITVTAVVPGSEGTDASVLAGTLYEFGPSPITFAQPVTLTVRYPEALPFAVRASRLVLCKMEVDVCVPHPSSVVVESSRVVRASITTFSLHGVTSFPEIMYYRVTDHRWWLHTLAGERLLGGGGPYYQYREITDTWAPDGSRFVVSSVDQGLITSTVDGTAMGYLGGGFCPRWLPDGRILFASHGSGLTLSDPDGASQVALYPIQSGGLELFYACTSRLLPDGRIGFYGQKGGILGIWSMSTAGSDYRLIVAADDNSQQSDFGWSSDGSYFAYASGFNDVNGLPGLYVARGDGTQSRLIAPGVFYSAWNPRPGSQELLFVSIGESFMYGYWPAGTPLPGVYIVNADGSNLRLLALSSGNYGPFPEGGMGMVRQPAWSPDGNRIAFAWQDGPSGSGVYIINSDGSGLQRLTGANTWRPSWRP